MAFTILVIAILAAGLALSRTRLAKELNSKRYMPFVYAAAAIYCGFRVYGAVTGQTRVWPFALLGALFLGGAVESAKLCGILRRN